MWAGPSAGVAEATAWSAEAVHNPEARETAMPAAARAAEVRRPAGVVAAEVVVAVGEEVAALPAAATRAAEAAAGAAIQQAPAAGASFEHPGPVAAAEAHPEWQPDKRLVRRRTHAPARHSRDNPFSMAEHLSRIAGIPS
jgi:hypothetical protein